MKVVFTLRSLFLQSGDIEIANHRTKETCHLKFSPYSYFSRDVPRKVHCVLYWTLVYSSVSSLRKTSYSLVFLLYLPILFFLFLSPSLTSSLSCLVSPRISRLQG